MTIANVCCAYLRHCAVEGTHCREARADRERTLSLFCAAVGHLRVEDAKAYHLVDFIESQPGWRSVSTRRQKANEIRAAFAWAVNQERIERNPFARVRYAEAERRPDLPDEALEVVARMGTKHFERAVRFLRLTGCRLSELCRAQWEDFDLERGVWTIHRHKSRRFTGKAKTVALITEAVDLLRLIRELPESGPTVFLNTHGRPWTRITLGQNFRRLKRRLKLDTKASLHGIRHRFGSAAITAGAPLKLVAAQLGHATTAVTERYYCDLSGAIEAVRKAAEMAKPR